MPEPPPETPLGALEAVLTLRLALQMDDPLRQILPIFEALETLGYGPDQRGATLSLLGRSYPINSRAFEGPEKGTP